MTTSQQTRAFFWEAYVWKVYHTSMMSNDFPNENDIDMTYPQQ